MDPEAARIVLRSGMPIELSPLNISRRTLFDKASYDSLVASPRPLLAMIAAQMGPRFARTRISHPHMYDEVAVASLVDPTLVKTRRMFVDVDPTPGITTACRSAAGSSGPARRARAR